MDKSSPHLSAKSASLPGYSNRGFHETYSSQQQATSSPSSYRSPLPLMQKERADKAAKVAVADPPASGKKKKWSGWSGFFRRNKPTQQTAPVDGNSSDETGHLASGHQQKALPASPPPTTSDDANKNKKSTTASRFLHPPRNLSKDRSPVVDTLSPLQSDLSASQTSLSRKERRDAILARAQARRNGGSAGGSSSDEAEKDAHLLAPSPSHRRHHHHSQESLTSNGSSCRAGHPRSRTGRTERYLQRRSRDEESLRREMQQQYGSPSCADYEWSASGAQLNPSSSGRWLLTGTSSANSIAGSWGGAHHPETTTATQSNGNQRVGESPVTLRKPTYSSNNNNSPMQVVRAQSAFVTHPKLSTPPPPPPRNPLKKSYLLQVQSNESNLQSLHSGRPTSYSFGELGFGQQQQQHDYQNVDQDGRLVPTPSAVHLPLTSPVQRRVLNSSPQKQPAGPTRHHSAFFPKSPSPYLQKTPEQERSKPPPWLANSAKSIGNAPPVREFWRCKDQVQQRQQQQETRSTKSARERLAPFHLTGNGSVSSLNSDLSSPMSRDAATNSSGDCPPFYMATGNTLASINGPGVIPPTPRRIPVVAHNNNNNNSNNVNNKQPHHVRELSQLKPSTDKHLEQAICELEQIYRSLKLDGDEDLLDRAERRDLPTAHQQLIQQQYTAGVSACSGSESGGDPLGHGITSDLDTMMNWSISGSFENLAATSERIRAPANRRSAVPDKVADDMAVRRLAAAARKSTANDPQLIAAQSGSYLLLSPSVTAATGEDQDGSSRSGSSPDEPDVIYDDVAYRQIRQANQSLKVAEPQPFGIPIGPVTPASPSDYLHTSVTPEQFDLRPLLHPTKYPDLVRDDLAFRNLRKDAGQLQLPPGPVNTDKLDDLLQETGFSKSIKKKRAVRSLSANIAQLIRKDASRPSGGGGVVDYNRQEDDEEDERYIGFNPFDSRAQSLSDLMDDSPVFSNNNNIQNKSAKTPRAVKLRSGLKRIGKSVEADDVDAIVQRQVRPLASWVERAHLSDVAASSTETITAERVPALAKLYPTSALMANKSPKAQVQQTEDLEMDHLISELSECGSQAGRMPQVDSSGLQLALKPPTGVVVAPTWNEVASPASHYWEESPLFQSQPQFQFPQQRSASPANSSDSGQVSCCAREVRQILHHQIQQEERERQRLASLAEGRKTSRADQQHPVGGELRTDKTTTSLDKSASSSKSRSVQSTAATSTAAPTASRENPVARKSSSGRRMSNNNETGNGSASATAVEKRDERIARYKEERRKQLQARHQAASAAGMGGLDHSSSSEDLPHEEQSYAKYKHRKQMQKQQLESRAVEGDSSMVNASDVVNSNLGSGGIKRFIKRESPLSEDNNGAGGPVRINRAARLRAAATSATPPPPPPPVDDKSVAHRTKRLSVPLLDISHIAQSDGQDTSVVHESPVVLRQKIPSSSSSSSLQTAGREKDKSTKRKSNLNRALTDEQILSTCGQIESADDVGKRIRRRKTGDLPVSASSAETDMSSSLDNNMMMGRRGEAVTRQSPQPAADLRANLRKTSQPPAFIRPPVSQDNNENIPSPAVDNSPSPSPYSSVPWRTGKVASASSAAKTPDPIKTEDLTARIEALTAVANQTVAKVDRLTGTPDREVNGAHLTPTGGVKAVATKLLNRVQPSSTSPLPVVGRRPAKIESPVASATSNFSPAVKLSPAVASTQQPIAPLSKNRPAVNQIDKTLAASSVGVALPARANNSNASATVAALGRNKTADPDATQNNAAIVKTVDNGTSSAPSTVKTVQGILKRKVEGGAADSPNVVRIRPEASAPELYPILRVEEENILPSDPVSILKRRFEETESSVLAVPADGSPEPHSILKRPLSRDGSAESGRSQSPVDPINSILKRASLTPSPAILIPDSSPSAEPRPILKKRSSADDPAISTPGDGPRPILKKKSSTDDEHEPAIHKPILKSGSRRTSSEQLDLEGHLSRLRRVESCETSPPGTGEPNTPDEPKEDQQEGEEPPRQLSVAERISSMELQTNSPVIAPWRHSSRPNPPLVPSNGVDTPSPAIWRRKSLDVNHVVEVNRTAGLVVEAVNRHVAETQAQTNGTNGESTVNGTAAVKPQTEVPEDEFDPSKLSLLERVKLFDRPPIAAPPVVPPSRPARSPRKAKAISRFLTQPITIAEMEKARLLRIVTPSSDTAKTVPPIEVNQVTEDVREKIKPAEDDREEGGGSGLERIRGILRRKSTENATEMKGILRSKSPSTGAVANEQPKSILKRHSPDVNESEQLSGSSSSSEDLVIPAENDLAAQLLNVELEAKNQPAFAQLPGELRYNTTTNEAELAPISVEEAPTTTTAAQQQKPVLTQPVLSIASQSRRETETIILESEGSSSGTETTTTVTFCLGGSSAGTTTVKQSQTKIKSHKIALMEELSESSNNVASRLAALQKSGDTEWRKRISKPIGSNPSSATEGEEATNSDGDIPTKSSIADRLKVLETAQKGWQKRVLEPDAARFTVAGKMGQRPASVHVLSSELIKPVSPLLDRKKKAPKPVPLRVKASDGSAASDSSPGTPSDDAKPPFNRSTSDPNGTPAKSMGPIIKTGKVTSRIVAVPRPDDETFTSFFAASNWSLASSSTQSVTTVLSSSSFGDITAEDFDRIAISRDLMVERRTVHVQRRKNNTSRNPIKSLILRPDMLRDEYEEVDTGVAEREVQRMKLEKLAMNSHLAVEALAGLASKEDFAAVALKSSKEKSLDTIPKTYLMQVKGRRQIQTRLVEPTYTSVNSGDCFILVTPTDVIQFIGRYANVIERARSSEVAQRIVAKRDLGSVRASNVQLIEEDKVGTNSFYGSSKRFWTALGRTEADQAINPAGPPEEDEVYESAITTTNTVWHLNDDHLEPCEEMWGTILQTDILDPNKVMVFDFGSEMYVWSGKMAPLEARKKAMELAKELWDGGYDYTECAINPIFQRPTSAEESKGQQRPDWALLRAAKQHMEPCLFREKFFDWPDKSALIKVKGQENEENKPVSTATDISSLEPYDAQLMLENQLDDPDLELEGSHLGRGVEYYDQAERRLHQISTLSAKVWHLLDYEKVLLDDVSRGQFHCRDTYIIRWQYRITVTGKDLKGQPSVHGLLGRDRFCYFIWHGAQAPSTDQGASALKTVELDEERGPHVRVQQGHEPPAFLAIFQGRMTVHSGKRGEADDQTGWRLYFVRGEKEEEAHLLQVGRCVQALRSRGSLLLINQSTGTIFLWHGAKSLRHTRQVASSAAAALKLHRPPELNIRAEANVAIKEQFEGAESREFWEGILGHKSGVVDRSLYLSLAERPKENRYDHTPRLFHLTSWTGQFRVDEVAPSSRFPQMPCPYPFVQEDLYSANQPTLFMLDNEHEVWLWQGWWPDQPDTDNTNTGSGKLRLAVERRCAMETVIEYCRLKGDNEDASPPPAYLVYAGLEPLAFTALFPYWTVDERVAQLNIQDGGKSSGESQSIQDVLDRLKRTTYSLSELQVRPPPEGVDPTRLESYLTDDDFQDVMGMAKSEFYALPAWRQTQLRKETGLF